MHRLIHIYKNLYIQNQIWWWFTVIWFVCSVVAGAAAFFLFPDGLGLIAQSLEDKIGSDKQGWGLVTAIFLNNTTATAVAGIGGIVLGLPALLVLSVNGLLIGYIVVGVLVVIPGDFISRLLFLLAGLLPHGIFEIPAILLAVSIGLQLGFGWIFALVRGQSGLSALVRSLRGLLFAVPIIVGLLFVAAVIEGFITKALVEWLAA